MCGFGGKANIFDEEGNCLLNTPDFVKGLDYLKSFYQDKLAPKDSLNWGYTQTVESLYSGVTAFLWNEPEVVGTMKEHMKVGEWATAPSPKGPKGTFPHWGYQSYCIAKASQHKDAAWTFIKWAFSPEPSLFFSKEYSVLPVTKSAQADSFWKGEDFKAFFDTLNDPDRQLRVPEYHLPEAAEFLEKVSTEEYQKVLLGQETSQQAADKWADYLGKAQKKYLAARKKG